MTKKALSGIADVFIGYDELDYASMTIQGNQASIVVQLKKMKVRKEKNEMDVFQFEKIVAEKLHPYEEK